MLNNSCPAFTDRDTTAA